MGLGREVHDGVGLGDQAVDQSLVYQVPLDHPDTALKRAEGFPAPRVSERIQHRHRHSGAFRDHLVDEIGPDEAGAASHQKSHRSTLVKPHRAQPGLTRFGVPLTSGYRGATVR